MKRVPARRTRERSLDPEDVDPLSEDNVGTALYAAHQTTLYVAPPVVNGRIPKNVYGNLDLYVPSMVPPGGIHISLPETARAAKILGIDYADAVTGFSFKGRHGTAVTKGAVVANEYGEAVTAVIQAIEDERTQAEEARRSLEAMRVWKRLLAGLRVRQRIEGYEIEGERDAAMQEKMEKVDHEEDEEGGGFLPDHDGEEYAQPTAGRSKPQDLPDMVEDERGGFLIDDTRSEEHAQVLPDQAERQSNDRFIDSFDDDSGGGFLVNDGDGDAEDALQEAKEYNRERGSIPETASRGETTFNLSHHELEEATMLQQFYETRDTAAPSAPENDPSPHTHSRPITPPEDEMAADESVESESSASEKGSLLSHDPDDEDADPDWIS